MKKITINLENIASKEDLYACITKKVTLREENLDGIYHYFVEIKEPVTLTLTGVGQFKNELGNYAGSLLKILSQAEKKNATFKVKLIYANAVRKHTGTENKKQEKEKKEKTEKKKAGCPYAKKCGGCSGQKRSYPEELEEKQKWVNKTLKPLTDVSDILPMERPLHYRHKVHAVFSFDRKGDIHAGVYEENTHKVVDVEKCRIEHEAAGEVIRTIKQMCKKYRIKIYDEDSGIGFLRHVLIRSSYTTGEMLVVLVTGSMIFPAKKQFLAELTDKHPDIVSVVQNMNDKKTSMVLGAKEIVLYGNGYVEDELCGKKFRISPKSFYQVNPEQTEQLYKIAMDAAALTGNEMVLDAYCGTGTIGIVAADNAKSVIGVELNPDAVRDAKTNARRNQTQNIQFVCADATKFMVDMATQKEHMDVVFLDPPRSGSTIECLDALAQLSPKKVVYISCNPETLARDLKYLMKKQYQIEACQPVDLFPWTKHCECVVSLVRKNS